MIYAHIEVLVTFLLVKKFSFLVIARNRSDVYGRNLVEIDPTSLPQLSKQLRDQNNSQKTEKTEIQNFEKNLKIQKTSFSRVPLFSMEFPYLAFLSLYEHEHEQKTVSIVFCNKIIEIS